MERRNMDVDAAAKCMDALSNPSRMRAMEILALESGDGLPSTHLAKRLDVATTTLSNQLLVLGTAQLVASKRVGRQVIYRVKLETVRELMEFLAASCAGGKIKGPLRISK